MTDLKHFDRSFALTNQLRTRATDNLIAAARASDVRKVVAQSYTGWPYGRGGALIKTEDDPLDPYPLPSMRESLQAIKHLEHAVVGAGGIALRYGAFYGAPSAWTERGLPSEVLRGRAREPSEGSRLNDPMLALVRKRMFPIIGDGGGVWSWLHLEDAAAATVLAVERGGTGVYNIADDDPAPVREWLPALAAVIGAPPPRRIPRFLARLIAGEAVVSMMTEVRGVSSAKAKRELGWTLRFPTWRRGFAESSARLSSDGGGTERVDSTRAATQHAGV